ncbi:MAG: helix-turn-helix domain-containing protein [Bacteroides sp.]|nr:helix-turn-helix domain-containing protein [Bacteroides sp.]
MRSVKQIVQDNDGFIWFATWNGLNRFDGHEFVKIKPGVNDEARAYSDRIGDIKLTSDGNLLCRVDDRLLLFDTDTYRFRDISTKLEEKFNAKFHVKQIRMTSTGEAVISLDDGRYILMNDRLPVESAELLNRLPERRYKPIGSRNIKDITPFRNEDIIYAREDSTGRRWLITRNGEIHYTPSAEVQPELLHKIDVGDEKLYFSTIDRMGNVWLRSSVGAYCIRTGVLPYETLPQPHPSQVRASFEDEHGVWLAEIGNKAVALYDREFSTCRYLDRDGRLHGDLTSFGSRIYAINKDRHGNIWLGTKPDGLYRLRPESDGNFKVDHFTSESPGGGPSNDNIYDITVDNSGRLWLATLGGGIDLIPAPGDMSPEFIHLANESRYPQEALAVRSISTVGDTLAVAATRGGLLVIGTEREKGQDKFTFRLHTSSPDRENSLGNIAVMYVLPDFGGHLLVATESDGVNMLESPLSAADVDFDFHRFNESSGIPSDVTITLAPDTVAGIVWVVSNGMIYSLDVSTGDTRRYSSTFWNDRVIFSEGNPLKIDGNRWLIGTETGGVIADFDEMSDFSYHVPVRFTSVSIQNRPETLMTTKTDSLVLTPDERNITVRFSALDYSAGDDFNYSFRINGEEWNNLGQSRSVSFLDMTPGTYNLEVRSSDSTGRWLDNGVSLTIVVTPAFHETLLAKILLTLLIIAFVGAICWIVVYIRRLNARQRETLEAYLKLLEAPATPTVREKELLDTPGDSPSQPKTGKLSKEDETFMEKVMEFVNMKLSDSEASIDDMAEYAAVSRSGLARKMKSLLGVTPAEFLKESRLSRAASLITSTGMPIKDIATDCGFSDLNYFGKCFKSAYSVSPTTYRKNAAQNG